MVDHESPLDDELFFDGWDAEDESEPIVKPPWRRGVIIAVAVITVVAMATVPLYNLINGARTPVADNGLEVCGFDYCVVQDAVRAAGLDLAMSRFSNMFLDSEEAARLADLLTERLGIQPVSVVVVDRIDGPVGGQYDPETRTVLLERPVRAWTILHEVSHAGAFGHGEDFQRVLIDLTDWLDQTLVG